MAKKPEEETSAEAMFERALNMADDAIERAREEAGDLSDFIALAMIEAAVNAALDDVPPADVIEVLRDLADQIEADAAEGDDD
jgi:hypothetical protein